MLNEQRYTRRARRGYTLIELLAYVTVFALATVMGSKLLLESGRLYRAQTGFVDQSRAVVSLEREFREAVQFAHTIEVSWQGYSTTPDTLVLRGSAPTGETQHTILRLAGAPARLSIITLRSQGDSSSIQGQKLPSLPLDSGEFLVENTSSGKTLLRFRYTVHSDSPASLERQLREVIATLQGAGPINGPEEPGHE